VRNVNGVEGAAQHAEPFDPHTGGILRRRVIDDASVTKVSSSPNPGDICRRTIST
jgi:hypothetical protein